MYPRLFSARAISGLAFRALVQRVSLSFQVFVWAAVAWTRTGINSASAAVQNQRRKGKLAVSSSARPGEHDIEPDVRQIRIAIGHRLHADLDQADDRQQGHQIPQPTHGQPPPRPQPHDQGRDRRQHEHGHGNIRPRHAMFRKRIERGQIDGVEDLADIRRVGHQGVFQPHGKRDRVDDFHRPALGDHGHDARCQRQQQATGPSPDKIRKVEADGRTRGPWMVVSHWRRATASPPAPSRRSPSPAASSPAAPAAPAGSRASAWPSARR